MTESHNASEIVRLDGHVVDSLLLAKVLDAIVDAGATYRIVELDVGTTSVDPSHVRLEVTASDEESLDSLLADLQVHGVNRVDASDAELVAAETRRRASRGVLPDHQPADVGASRRTLGALREARDGLRPRRGSPRAGVR